MLHPQWNHCFSICWTAQSKTARSLYWTRCRLEWSEVGEQPHPCHTEKEWNEHSSSTPTSCLLLHPQPIPVQSTAVCTCGGGRAHKYATAALVSHSGLRTEAAWPSLNPTPFRGAESSLGSISKMPLYQCRHILTVHSEFNRKFIQKITCMWFHEEP
jgi:hypothetical protein